MAENEFESIEDGIELRSDQTLTYWGYTSERKIANYPSYSFPSLITEIGCNPSDTYEADYYGVTKEIVIPAGYKAEVIDTPNAGYKPNGGWNRGITGYMSGSKFIMYTRVYAVRKNVRTDARVDKYLPKINVNSNNLQELPWNVRIYK